MDGRTEGQTDGRTDKGIYRVACPQLKREGGRRRRRKRERKGEREREREGKGKRQQCYGLRINEKTSEFMCVCVCVSECCSLCVRKEANKRKANEIYSWNRDHLG